MAIPDEALRLLRDGCDNEGELLDIIRAHLATPNQRIVLAQLGLDIADCLNGRYGEDAEAVIEQIYADWNTKCGFRAFGAT